MRNRRVGAANRASDPLGAGLYVFSGVRWLSPDDPCEAQLLSDGLARLVSTFPHLGGAIQLERLKSIGLHPAAQPLRVGPEPGHAVAAAGAARPQIMRLGGAWLRRACGVERLLLLV